MDELDLEALANHFGGRKEHKGRLREGGKKKKVNLEKGGQKQGEALLAEDMASSSVMPEITPSYSQGLIGLYEAVVEDEKKSKTTRRMTEPEKINIDEEVVYYTEHLIPDLKVIYPEKTGMSASGEVWITAKENIKKHHIRWLTKPSDRAGNEGKPVRRFADGRRMIKEIQDYLDLKIEEPENWKEEKSLINESRISLDRLREARRKKSEPKNEPVKQRNTEDEVSFEDKVKMVDGADYGGSLFPAFKKYINGEALPVGLEIENVMSQIGKLFPFDVKKFAGEMRLRRENTEKPVAEWEGKYKNDSMFIALKQVVDREIWQKKVAEWSQMDEISRDNSLLIYRALMKIKGSGMVTLESQRLWDSQKGRLEELGLML